MWGLNLDEKDKVNQQEEIIVAYDNLCVRACNAGDNFRHSRPGCGSRLNQRKRSFAVSWGPYANFVTGSGHGC